MKTKTYFINGLRRPRLHRLRKKYAASQLREGPDFRGCGEVCCKLVVEKGPTSGVAEKYAASWLWEGPDFSRAAKLLENILAL
jgi:hypothetical protein